jgi:hypothetical protein
MLEKKNIIADELSYKSFNFSNLAEKDDENIIKNFINSKLNFI